MMTGSRDCRVLRALRATLSRLADFAGASLGCGVLIAGSVIGHSGCKRRRTDGEQRYGKCDCCLAKHDRPPLNPMPLHRGKGGSVSTAPPNATRPSPLVSLAQL